jgi:hypothetical protein
VHSLVIERGLFDPSRAPFDLFKVTTDVRREGRVGEEPPKMTCRSGIRFGEFVVEQKRKPRRIEDGSAGPLVVKQA